MSLTSYRAAPPRVCGRCVFRLSSVVCGMALLRPACCAPPVARRRAWRVGVCAAFGAGSGHLAATDFPAPCGAVSWALAVFTSEFGMGSGGVPPPWPPGVLSLPARHATTGWPAALGQVLVPPHRPRCRGWGVRAAWRPGRAVACPGDGLRELVPRPAGDVGGCCAGRQVLEPFGRLGPVS